MQKFTLSQIKDPKFYQENRKAILAAYTEPGRPRVIDDTQPEETNTDGLRMYEPIQGKSFSQEQIAAMDHQTYQANRAAILAAARGQNGATIVPRPQAARIKPITFFESDKAFVESGGKWREQRREQYAQAAEDDNN